MSHSIQNYNLTIKYTPPSQEAAPDLAEPIDTIKDKADEIVTVVVAKEHSAYSIITDNLLIFLGVGLVASIGVSVVLRRRAVSDDHHLA